ncbi:serine/threonine protein kinase [Rivularia sp. PCC 7116]|uniref:tetratricopeptide repeat protein n=1 Tax=Rivularia sp. PCC 7116 TaxID=373994 RepID=UPI00029F2936|nr:tetratricopeptide repeat protein [Rivularia sp. PCC 7116]AFY56384.1 serine/threonine protein kinase [Rivularia sp. PCC 7116]
MSNIILERYRIIELLSGTPGGRSYLSEDTSQSNFHQYVVKQFLPSSKDSTLLKISHDVLETETKPLEYLAKKDDRILHLSNFFIKDKNFYLVREYILGQSLRKEIITGQKLSSEKVLEILLEVLEILVIIHYRGIIHRNIKPANIIRRESDNKLILTDFGAPQEAVSNLVASSEYMPIEQIYRNPQLNSDIYALGIIAIEALTGLSASEITNRKNQKNSDAQKIVWYPRSHKVKAKLAKIIDKMVDLNYQNRYQSAKEVLNDLQTINQPQPNLVLQPLKTQFSKNPKLFLFLGSFITVSAVGWFFFASKDLNYARKLYYQGIANYEKADYKQAVKLFSQAIKINPQYSSAYNFRGDAYYRLGNYEKSQQDSSAAIRNNPQDANAYYDRAFSLYLVGEFNGAIIDYNQAIKLNPEYADAYYGRGLARHEIKENRKAIADLNQAIAIKPKFTKAYFQRGIVHREIGDKLEAIKDFSKAIEINPKYASAYYERGKTRYALNEKAAAKKDFTKVIELDSRFVDAYIARADVHTDLGYPKQAYDDYEKAIEMNPEDAKAYVHRGKYRFQMKDIEGAIENYNQAIKLNSTQSTAYNNRGNAYLELGKWNKALADYSKAIELNPEYASAYYNRGLLRTDLAKVPGAIEDYQAAADIFLKRGEKNNYQDAMSRIKELTP